WRMKKVENIHSKKAKAVEPKKRSNKEFFEEHIKQEMKAKDPKTSKKKIKEEEPKKKTRKKKASSPVEIPEAVADFNKKTDEMEKAQEQQVSKLQKIKQFFKSFAEGESKGVALKVGLAAGATGLAATTVLPIIDKVAKGEGLGAAIAETAKNFWGGVVSVLGFASSIQLPLLAGYVIWKFAKEGMPILKNENMRTGAKVAGVGKVLGWTAAKAYLLYHSVFRFAEEIGIWGMGVLDAAKIAILNTAVKVNELTTGLIAAHPYIFIPGFVAWRAWGSITHIFHKIKQGEKITAKEIGSTLWEAAKALIPAYAIYKLVAVPINSWLAYGKSFPSALAEGLQGAWNDFIALTGSVIGFVAANPIVSMAIAGAIATLPTILKKVFGSKGAQEGKHHH
ncbi:MAG: hypothetical protein QW275_03320, partial [Candidatus Anstonellaceae archaeon]